MPRGLGGSESRTAREAGSGVKASVKVQDQREEQSVSQEKSTPGVVSVWTRAEGFVLRLRFSGDKMEAAQWKVSNSATSGSALESESDSFTPLFNSSDSLDLGLYATQPLEKKL